MTDIILASASPRRRELLAQLGVIFSCHAVDIDETCLDGEDVEACIRRLSLAKADAALRDFPDAIVIGSDTMVVVDGAGLGKPQNQPDSARMLQSLSGRTHDVMTGIAVINREQEHVMTQRTSVSFRVLSAEEISQYWQTGEPQGKAGSYAVQGLAAQFIERIEGSYSGVMGLPLYETAQLLNRYGVKTL